MRDEHRKARARHLIKTDYGAAAAFVAATGISKGRVAQVTGKTEPFGEDAAGTWEEVVGLPSGWFSNTWPTPKEAKANRWKTNEPYPTQNADAGDFVAVQRANVKFSNGTGKVVYHMDDKPPLSFRADFLRKLGISQGNAVVVDAEGISNQPKITDGAVVLVDRGDQRINGDFFAFRDGDELLIKRLSLIEGVGVLATAENPDWKPKTKVYTAPDGFEIIGRCRWMGAEL